MSKRVKRTTPVRTVGDTVVVNSNQQQAYNYLVRLSDAYYNTDTPLVSDTEFDRLVAEYEAQHHTAFKYLGTAATAATHKKTKLPVPMMSLNKCKDEQAIRRFVNSNESTSNSSTMYIYSEKLDGVSLLYVRTIANNERLYTRGDGETGTDVSHLLPWIKIFCRPLLTASSPMTVRGELIIPKEWKQQLGQNLRNIVCGAVNAKTVDETVLSKCLFVAYAACHQPRIRPSEAFEYLSDCGFLTPQHFRLAECTLKSCNEVLTKLEASTKFDIDGVVVAVDQGTECISTENPKNAMAFKRSGISKQTTVVEVLWQSSRYGTLHPRVQIVPVDIDGCTIQYVSGIHAEYIHDNNIGPGTVVEVERSGDVIPNIVRVVQATQAQLPPEGTYEFQGVHIKRVNSHNGGTYVDPTVVIDRLTYSLKYLKAKGISEQTVKKLYEAGYSSELQLWNVTVEDLRRIQGFQEKLAANIFHQLQETKLFLLALAKKHITEALVMLLLISACFPSFGESKLRKIVMDSGIDVLSLVLADGKEFSLSGDLESKLAAVSIKTQAAGFVEGCKMFRKHPGFQQLLTFVMSHAAQARSPTSTTSTSVTTPASEVAITMNAVCTGFRDPSLTQQALAKGIKITDGTVSKKTGVVIVAVASSTSSKVEAARKAGIPVVTKEEFVRQYLQ